MAILTVLVSLALIPYLMLSALSLSTRDPCMESPGRINPEMQWFPIGWDCRDASIESDPGVIIDWGATTALYGGFLFIALTAAYLVFLVVRHGHGSRHE